MQSSVKSLPDNVIAELKRGNFVLAVKLLRESGLSLKEAMAAAGEYSGKAIAAARDNNLPSGTPANGAASHNSGSATHPRNADRFESKNVVADKLHALKNPRLGPKLAPGEVPRSNATNWVLFAAIAGILIYYFLR